MPLVSNRRKALVSCLGLAIASLLPSAAMAQGNVLKNPGFESDSNGDGNPDFWLVYPGIRESVIEPSVEIVSAKDAPEGRSYIRLAKTGGKALVLTQIVNFGELEKIDIGNDRKFILKGKARSRGLSGGGAVVVVQLFCLDSRTGARKFSGRFQSGKIEGDTGWTSWKIPLSLADAIPAGEECSDIEVNLELDSDSGSVDFDAITLQNNP